MDSQCAGSPIARARKNLAALEALAAAEERGRATAEEIAAMEAYSGWGGAQKAFSEKAEGEWGEVRDRLRELLSDDEFASQRHTVLTAFYTPAPVIGAIYDALREAGIGQGDTPAAILEPGCGTGNFMRLAPAASAGIAGRRSSPSRSRHTTGRARSPFKTVTTAHRCPPATR